MQWVSLLAAAIAVTSALAFLVATFATALLFRSWGLSAFQFASPTDLALTAADMLVVLLPALAIFLAAYLMAALSTHVGRWWVTVVLLVGLVAGAILIAETEIMPRVAIRKATEWLLAISASVAMTAMLIELWRRRTGQKLPINAICASLLLTLTLLAAADITKSRLSWGTGPKSFVQEGVDNCPMARAIWIGTRALVVECTPAGKRVLLNPEGLSIGGRPAEELTKRPIATIRTPNAPPSHDGRSR